MTVYISPGISPPVIYLLSSRSTSTWCAKHVFVTALKPVVTLPLLFMVCIDRSDLAFSIDSFIASRGLGIVIFVSCLDAGE